MESSQLIVDPVFRRVEVKSKFDRQEISDLHSKGRSYVPSDDHNATLSGSLLKHGDSPTYHASEIFPANSKVNAPNQSMRNLDSNILPSDSITSISATKLVGNSGTLYRKSKYVLYLNSSTLSTGGRGRFIP
jgi:hypothetical protein